MFDAIVVGAGVAGTYSALRLAAQGHRVLIVEKQADAGVEVCCTGIVGLECLAMLERLPGLSLVEILLREARSARFYAPSGRSLRLARSEPVAFVLDRGALDRALLLAACGAGASLQTRTLVTGIERSSGGLRLQARHRGRDLTFQTRSLVLATGYDSPLARALGLGRISDCLIGAQAEVRLGDVEEIEVYADSRFAPGGFAWLVPTRPGEALVGLVGRRGHPGQLDVLLDQLRRSGRVLGPDCGRRYGPIPIRPRARSSAERVLAVGDAAGQVKPTTGGGIYYGLLGAALACEVLDAGLRSAGAGDSAARGLSEAALSEYDRRWRARLAQEQAIGYLAQRLWSRLDNPDIELLLDLAIRADLAERVTSSPQFSFDWHAPLLQQLAGVLTLPRTPAALARL